MIKVWMITHPGTGEPIICMTFDECMIHWFEGFNLPRACTIAVTDTDEEAYKRVREYISKPASAKGEK